MIQLHKRDFTSITDATRMHARIGSASIATQLSELVPHGPSQTANSFGMELCASSKI